MSAIVPRTTPTGGLPTISYIMRKPEPLGTEFKVPNNTRFQLTTIF